MEVAGDLLPSFEVESREILRRFSMELKETMKRSIEKLQQDIGQIVDEALSPLKVELKQIRKQLEEEEQQSDLCVEEESKQTDLRRRSDEFSPFVAGANDVGTVVGRGVVSRAAPGGEFFGGQIDGEIGCGVEGFAMKLKYGERLGDFGDGFTGGGYDIVGELSGGYIGRARGFHKDCEGVMAMVNKPSTAGEEIAGRTTNCGGRAGGENDVANGKSDASGSGGLGYFSLIDGGGGCFVASDCCGGGNGLRSWEKELQKFPEDEYENGRSVGFVVGLEKKPQIEYACKGILVISLKAISVDHYLMGHVLLRKASRLQTNSNQNNGLLSCIGPAYLHSFSHNFFFLTRETTNIGTWTCGLKLYWYILLPKAVPSPTNEELQRRWKPGICRKGFTVQLGQGREYLANYHPP